jgi:uncharacterized protein (UPF0332 family)
MITNIENRRNFRLEQGREKLRLAELTLHKGFYNDSVVYSYISMFYSVRVLLINRDDDSDDHEKILELLVKYFEPSGWTNVNIVEIMKKSKEFKESIDSKTGTAATREDAELMYKNANLILDEVLKFASSH